MEGSSGQGHWQRSLNYFEEDGVVDSDGFSIGSLNFPLWSDKIPSNREILNQFEQNFDYSTAPYWFIFDPNQKIIDLSKRQSSATSTSLRKAKPISGNQGQNDRSPFIKFQGRDFLGVDLTNGIIRQTDVKSCLLACEKNSNCKATTFDRWNRICFLKSINGQSSNLLVNSKADSYIITRHSNTASDVSEIKSEVKTVTRKGKGFKSKPDESFPAFTLDQCEQTTKSKQALAFNWRPKTKKCEVFFSPAEYFNLDNSIVGYFHQEAPN